MSMEHKVMTNYITKFSIENRLAEGLRRVQMSVIVFSELARLNGIDAGKSRLFAAFGGGRALPNETALALWGLFRQVDSLDKRGAPFKLNFTDAEVVNGWLIAARQGTLTLRVERTDSEETDLETKDQTA
jgi:hypothetical protein